MDAEILRVEVKNAVKKALEVKSAPVERMYRMYINMVDSKGRLTGSEKDLGFTPMTHAQCMTVKSKFSRDQQANIFVKEV